MIDGPWFITPHAVQRYRERVRPGLAFEAARQELIELARVARYVKQTHGGMELWRTRRPREVRLIVAPGLAGEAPSLITVKAAHDGAPPPGAPSDAGGCEPTAEMPARVLYRLAGQPSVDGAVELAFGRCWLCALPFEGPGVPVSRWVGANFTDQNKVRWSDGSHVCAACVWVCAWNPPPGVVNPPGKKGLNLRLFSHFYDADGYVYANKADKAVMRDWLSRPKSPPWFAAIADTGQKHTLPWTGLSFDPHVGVVRFEEADVYVDVRTFGPWCAATAELLTAGATKEEVQRGEYRPATWLRCEAQILDYEERYGTERGGGTFALAVWLSQRDEEQVVARRAAEEEARGRRKARSNSRPGGGPDDGGEGRVPRKRRRRARALGSAPVSGPHREPDERSDGRMGHRSPPAAPARRTDRSELEDEPGSLRGGRRGR